MRKIVLMLSMSLDGFIEGPNREIDWHLVDDELHSHFNEQLSAVGAFLNGRVTYELMAGYWPVPEQVMALKAQPGGDLALGGADLAAAFRRHGLIDEYRIYVHPVLIGRGKPLFQPLDARTSLRLVESRTFGNGVVLLRYQA